MNAESLMTREVCVCSPNDSLQQAARIMWESDVGCLVVTDAQGRPIGMITDRDVAMAAYTQGAALRDAKVASAMSRQLLHCSPSTSLGELEKVMQASQIRRIPVVDTDGKLVGVVTLADIARSSQAGPLRMTEAPGVAKTLASITQRRQPSAVAAE